MADNETILTGSPAAPGSVLGPALVYRPATPGPQTTTTEDSASAISRLDMAIATADAAIAAVEERLQAAGQPAEAEIFAAHRMLLGDPSLRERAVALISSGQSPDAAITTAGEEQAAELLALADPYFSARATDVRDVVGQVRRILRGEHGLAERLTTPAIVVALDLGPSDLMSVPREQLLGFALAAGGPTAHSALLARALGIPAVTGLGPELLDNVTDTLPLALDGAAGTLTLQPAAATRERVRVAAGAASARLAALRDQRDLPSVTSDGVAITLLANAASAVEARSAHEWGAAGIGLLRTELLFLDRPALPDEAEQLALYQAVAAEFPGGPIVVRTLDIGGDKQLPAFPLPHEDNPFLGWRGIRIGLSEPRLLLPQLRALLRAGAAADIRIMLPMITTRAEVHAARRLLQQAQDELAAAEVPFARNPQLGIMIEVPAAALTADILAREVDFFSIGTNDLIQYTQACDRTNARVKHLYEPLAPAVLRLIAQTAEAGRRHNRHVAVCGAMAGDPALTALLIGLGVQELSCPPTDVPLVRAAIRATSAAAARDLAAAALAAPDAAAVRDLIVNDT